MNNELLKYLGQAIVRHLNGDTDKFKHYRDKAINIYEKENSMITLEELIDRSTKLKLYEMVS